jgi:hypothetical protein
MEMSDKQTWIYRFWYSPKQDEVIKGDQDDPENWVNIDGQWVRYTECASVETHPDYKPNWDDAKFLGEAHINATRPRPPAKRVEAV